MLKSTDGLPCVTFVIVSKEAYFKMIHNARHTKWMNFRTISTVVIHQYDFLYQFIWASVQDAVYCAQQRRPSLVMETDDNTGCWETRILSPKAQ